MLFTKKVKNKRPDSVRRIWFFKPVTLPLPTSTQEKKSFGILFYKEKPSRATSVENPDDGAEDSVAGKAKN